MTKQTTFDLDEYSRRVCEEICKYHDEAKYKIQKETVYKPDDTYMDHFIKRVFTDMHERHCINCPHECMINLLREERDQNMKLTIEYDLEEV